MTANALCENFGHKMVTPFRILLLTTCHKCLYDNMGDTELEPVTPLLVMQRKEEVEFLGLVTTGLVYLGLRPGNYYYQNQNI